MGLWKINADIIAGSRFVISPLAETVASLMVLAGATAGHPGEQAWLRAHLPAYRERLAGDPVTARLVVAALGSRRWIADFVTPPPGTSENLVFSAELAVVRATAARTAVADLRAALGGTLPGDLDRPDLAERMADLLDWVWTQTVLQSWPRRQRVLEADIGTRASRLGEAGWAVALGEMRPGMRWRGDGVLQVNAYDYPARDISRGQLFFIPVTPRTRGWAAWAEPYRHAIVYPCMAPLADTEDTPVPQGLARLLGPARASVLMLLEDPLSTTQLVALTGQRLGSVGRHLKVLLDAGLVQRYRAGRRVLYQRTQTGNTLVEAQPDRKLPR